MVQAQNSSMMERKLQRGDAKGCSRNAFVDLEWYSTCPVQQNSARNSAPLQLRKNHPHDLDHTNLKHNEVVSQLQPESHAEAYPYSPLSLVASSGMLHTPHETRVTRHH
jgi:hypothetical protein